MKKYLWALYFIIQNGIPMTITNMSQDDIVAVYGKNAIVDKATYDAAVAAIPPYIPPVDPIKVQAIADAKNGTKTAPDRIDALIKAVGL